MNQQAESVEFAVQFLRDVFPTELEGRGVYVLSRDDAPTLWCPMFDDAAGHITYSQFQQVQAYLEQAGQWCGQGFACVIDFGKVSSHFRTVRALVLHEFIHYVQHLSNPPTPQEWAESPMPDSEETSATQLLYGAAVHAKPWYFHGAPFIRLACHAWARSHVMGRPVWAGDIWAAGDMYGLSPVSEYLHALDVCGELDECRDMSLVAVAKLPVPALFQDVFEYDTRQER